MALLLDSYQDDSFLRDAWGFSTYSDDLVAPDEGEPRDVVPCTTRELASWLTVIRAPRISDKRRPYIVVHNTESLEGPILEVSLRLQGFLGVGSDLSPFGCWDGAQSKAVSAVQRLVLHGGDNPAWLQQLRQLNNIISMIWKSIDSPASEVPRVFRVDQTTKIAMQRRVFIKVQNHVASDPTAPLPLSAAAYASTLRSMAHRWAVSNLSIGIWDGESLQETVHGALDEGDFVDVMVSIEIVYKGGAPRIYFVPDRVIQLAPCAGPLSTAQSSESGQEVPAIVVTKRAPTQVFASTQ